MDSKIFARITAEDIARIHVEEDCGCCEVNDYDPAPEDHEAPGSCLNCGHSPEEHNG